MLKHLVVVLAALSLTLVAATAEAQTRSAVALRPGDLVQLNIWPDDQGYSGEYVVEDNGILVVPFLGEIQAAGVSVEQLRQTIREGYGQTRRELVVTIRPQFRVGVMGAVRSPSVYPVSPSQNIFDVIAMAGGFAQGADQRKVRIVRDREVITVDALMSLETGIDLDRYRLRSGDRIIVPPASGITARTIFEIVRTVSTLVLVYDRLANSN